MRVVVRLTRPRVDTMKLAEFIEREAGHVVVGLLLIFTGAVLWKAGVPKAEDLVPFALGVIARSMIGERKAKPDA
jgi:hypothetical protein